MYITLVFDAATGRLEQKLTTILVEPGLYDSFDYAEEQDGFGKTAEGPKLELTDAAIPSLFAYQPTTSLLPRELSTNQQLVRSAERTIASSDEAHDGWFKNSHADPVKFSSFVQADSALLPDKVDLKSLKDNGYKTVSFYVNLNVAEVNDGYQHIGLFKSRTETDMDLVQWQEFEHDKEKADKNWRTHDLNFQNIPIDTFTLDEFVIRYKSRGESADVWKNKDLKIKLVFRK